MKLQPKSLLAVSAERVAFVLLLAVTLGLAFERARPIIQWRGFAITAIELLIFLAIVAGSAAQIFRWRQAAGTGMGQAGLRWADTARRVALAAIGWLVAVGAATLAADDPSDALKFFIKVCAALLVGGMAYALTYSEARLQLVARLLALGGLTVALLGVLEAANIPLLQRWLVDFRENETLFAGIQRVSATLVHPNTLAMILEIALPITLAWYFTTTHKWPRVLLGVGLLVEVSALVLTLSRGGLVASMVSVGLMVVVAHWYGERTFAQHGLAVGSSMLLVTGMVVLLNPLLLVRFVSEGSNELWYRAEYHVPTHVSAPPDSIITIPVTMTNRGLQAWNMDGPKPFNLAYHLVASTAHDTTVAIKTVDTLPSAVPSRAYVVYGGLRTPLPRHVPPQAQITLFAQVQVPAVAGEYEIEWDLIQEGVTWFSKKNSVTGATRLTVVGLPLAAIPLEILPQADAITTNRPGRLALWGMAWQMWRAHPLFGVGPRAYQQHYNLYAQNDTFAPHAHSLWLNLLAETGMIGFLAYAWLTAQLLHVTWRGRQLHQQDQALWIWWLALLASLTAWLIHGLVDYPYSTLPAYLAFWIVAGLLLRISGFVDRASALQHS